MPFTPNLLPTYDEATGAGPARDSTWDLFKSSAASTWGNLRYGLPAAVERVAGTLTPEDERYYAAWNAAKQQQAQEIAPTGAATFDDWWSGRVGFGEAVGENLATMVPQLAGTVAGGIGGGLVGGPGGALAGATAASTPFFAGASASRALQETGGIDQGQAARSLLTAPVQAALDTYATRFIPGAGKLFGPLASAAEGNVVSRVAKQALKGAVAEALTETGQQVGERWAAGLDLTSPEANQEFLQSFATAGMIGGALGGVGGVTRKKPTATTNEDIKTGVDMILAGGQPSQIAGYLPAPEMYVDSAGRAALGDDGMAELMATPRPSEPPFDLDSAGVMQLPQMLALPAPTQDRLDTTPAGATVVNDPQLAQLKAQLETQPSGDLKAILERAGQPDTKVSPILVGAVEQELASRSAQLQGVAAPVPANLEASAPAPAGETFEGLFQGVKGLNQDLVRLRGKPQEEVVAGVRTLLENNDTRKSTWNVAERLQKLGLLELENTPTMATVEQAPQAATPSLLSQALRLSQKPRDAFVSLLSAKDRKMLSEEAFREMGASSPAGLSERQAQSRSDAIVALTQKLGVTDDSGLTQAGEALALKQPISTEEVSRAALAQGFEGKQMSMFLRGAEGRQVAKFDTPSDQEAYTAGQRWKVPETRTAEQTQEALYSTGDKVGLLTDGGKTKARSAVGRVETQNPEFARRDSLVGAIDQRQESGIYPKARPEDVEQLRRMVREGATDEEVNAAEEMVREGDTLFPEPPAGSVPDIETAVITRGAPTTRSIERAQLKARDEINLDFEEGKITAEDRDAQINKLQLGNMVSDDLGLGRNATARMVAAAKREKAEKATVRKREAVRQQVRERYNESDKTPADRRQFIRLTHLLNEGNTGDVLASVEDASQNPLRATREDDLGDPPVAESVAMELALEGKPIDAAMDFLVDEASNSLERSIAEAVRSAIKGMRREGMRFEFKIAHIGDTVPIKLTRAVGLTRTHEGTTTVWLNGSDVKGKVGTEYTTLLHEMIHAATSTLAVVGAKNKFRHTKLGEAVRQLLEVSNHIVATANNLNTSAAAVQARARGGSVIEQRDAMVAAGIPRVVANVYFGANTLATEREIVAWGLSDPEFQQWLDKVAYTPKQTLLGRFVAAVRDVLGLSEREDTALKSLLEASERIMGVAEQDSYSFLSDGGWLAGNEVTEAKSVIPAAVQRSTQALKQALPQLDAAVERLPLKSALAAGRKALFGWMSVDHIAEVYGDILPGLSELPKIDAARHATQAKWAQLFSPIHQAFGQLKQDYQDRTEGLMSAAELGVDPSKVWDDQPWLHKLPNADEIKSALVQWNNDVNTLRRNKADGVARSAKEDVSAAQVYDDLKHLNEAMLYSDLSVSLSNRVDVDPEMQKLVAGFGVDVTEAFRENTKVNTDPKASKDFWRQHLDGQVENVEKFIKDFRGLKIQVGVKAQQDIELHLEPIELQVRAIKQALARVQQAPYFHLGRHGDDFVAFAIKNSKGVSDKVAVEKVIKAFADAGLHDAYISTESTRPEVYMRFETPESRAKAEAVAKQLRKDEWLDPETDIKGGPRAASGFSNSAGKPEWLEDMVSRVAASPVFDTEGLTKEEADEVKARKKQTISQLRGMWLDTLSDTSLVKVMSARKGVRGYTKDMMRNYASRHQIHTLAIANMTAAPKTMTAFTSMRAAVNQARNVDDPNHKHVQTMFDLLDELLKRQGQRGEIEEMVFSDRLRAGTNAFFLGLSPGYLLTQITQLPVLLLPELGKKHGFSKSFGAIAKQTGTAFKLMSAVWAEGSKRGFDGIADMAITPGAFQRAGLSATQEAFLQKVIASGTIDIGSAMRELGRTAEGELNHKGDRAIRWATSLGLYAETLTRVTAALAAQELYADGKAKGTAEEYAQYVIGQAMFNYAQSNTARNMGKFGVLGKNTPMFTQFMQYSAQLMQKLYREAHKAFGGDKESQLFLAGHFAAVTALAGTLGLPFATLVASATEMLVDLFGDDDEPYDATAAWRSWLAGMFGKLAGPEWGATLATTAARGVPRGMLGFDLSERIGEQDLLPFTDVMTDRRSMKDALEAHTYQSLGASASMVFNVASGLTDIANGDVVQGMQKALPVFMSNAVKGASVYATGEFKTSKGETLPIAADGWDALAQLLGVNPAAKAEYAERNRDYNELKTSATARATQLRNKITRALLEGDTTTAREYIEAAQAFDADNPDFAVLSDIEGSLRSRVRKQAVARATGLPLGVGADDTQARELLSY